jgi:hypothetical protein
MKAGLAPAALLLAALARAAAPEDLASLEAEAEYGYFTEDLRSLVHLESEHAALARSEAALDRYHYAHLELRHLQLALAAGRGAEAERAADACLAALDPELGGEAPPPEALALAALCSGLSGAEGRMQSRLSLARRLAPTNPRVLLSYAWSLVLHEPKTAERARALAAAQAASASFDRVTADAPGSPSWGAADACLIVAAGTERAGDAFGARNAYEKCLVLAPDFKAARRRLAALSAGPRR